MKSRSQSSQLFAVILTAGILVCVPSFSYGQEQEETPEPSPDLSSDSDPLRTGTFTVDSTGDQPDAVADGLCATSVGTCTLRAASEEGKVNNTQDRIIFNIPTSDPGFVDRDGGPSDMLGGDDYWQINFAGSANDLFMSAVVVDVSTQTANQGDTNSNGSEIQVNFSSNPQVKGASTINNSDTKVLGITTQGNPQPDADYTKLAIQQEISGTSNREWNLTRNSNPCMVEIDDLLYFNDTTATSTAGTTGLIIVTDLDGNLVKTWGTGGTAAGEISAFRCLTSTPDGNLLIGETTRIQKFDTDGNYIFGFGSLGSGLGQFTILNDIIVDPNGFIYTYDSSLRRVSKFDDDGTFLTSWGGSGTGNGQFNTGIPNAINYDSSNNIYVMDRGNERIQKFDSSGNFITAWNTRNGGSTFVGGSDMYIYQDNIYLLQQIIVIAASPDINRIQIYNTSGGLLQQTVLDPGYSDGQAGLITRLYVDNDTIYTTYGPMRHQILLYDLSVNFIERWGRNIKGQGLFYKPSGIRYHDNKVYVNDAAGINLQILDEDLNYISTIPSPFDFELNRSTGDIVFDSQGNMYVSVYYNHTSFTDEIFKYDSNGNLVANWQQGPTCTGPAAMNIDASDNIYVMCQLARRGRKLNTSGTVITTYGTGVQGTGNGQFSFPSSIASDSAGNVYITDPGRDDVQIFNSAGTWLNKWNTLQGDETSTNPADIYIDEDDNVYILDSPRIEKYTTSGTFITSYAPGLSGTNIDFGPNGEVYNINILTGKVYKFVIDITTGTIDFNNFLDDETTDTTPDIEGTAADDYSPLTDIRFSFSEDMTDAVDCVATDGTIDEIEEEFSCPISTELALGEYTIYIETVDDKGNSKVEQYTFNVVEEPPEEPEEPGEQPVYEFDLIDPIDGVVIEDNTPKLDWEDLDAASELDFYDLYINNKFVKNTGKASEYQIPNEDALPNGDYTWQVLGYKFVDGEAVEIDRTSIGKFTVKMEDNPVTPPIIPPETGGEKPEPERPKPTTPSLPDFVTNITDFRLETLTPAAGIVAASATVALSTTLLTAGKDVLEKLGFVIGGIVPKKRKYWGIVFDGVKSQGIPFAVVRVYDNNKKLINTTVTDLDGRYGIPVSESGTYFIEAKAQGFKLYSKTINLSKTSIQEIVENIALERLGQKLDPFRASFFYYMSEILLIIRILVIVLMTGGFLYSLYVFVAAPILLNLVILLVYFSLFGLNLYQEYKYRRNIEGRVIDLSTRSGLPNTTVILYNSKGEQEDIRLTNAKGVAKLRAQSGIYQVQGLKSGYVMSDLENGKSSLELKVDERGYLTKAIFMSKK